MPQDDTFDLSKVPDLGAIMESFSSRQLSFFCRLLVLLIFESSVREANNFLLFYGFYFWSM